jgi:hypothetical protein
MRDIEYHEHSVVAPDCVHCLRPAAAHWLCGYEMMMMKMMIMMMMMMMMMMMRVMR